MLIGSVRRESRSRIIAESVGEALSARGAGVDFYGLAEFELPIMDPIDRARGTSAFPAVQALRESVRRSHAVVLATPSYHDAPSGAIKNALDHLTGRDLGGRVFGLLCHAGRRTTQPLAHLRISVRAVGGFAICSQVCTEDNDLAFGPNGLLQVASRELAERIARFADELVAETRLRHLTFGAHPLETAP